ncbi:hypothetical protein C0Q70_07647 [Pomacea canaliculata]|uniref:Fibronectin type-III domain-containing protein n=1 Tax=Pomacea canaliculata TaxID=400727 RepID=A0A2T7PFL4_POMCA|nr:hypothetical protein C0Q70_07647 [Pomacea canaliculata]
MSSADGRKPLVFEVGSQIILKCRMKNHQTRPTSLKKISSGNLETTLDVDVVEDGVQYVVHNATLQDSGNYYCLHNNKSVAMKSVTVGYVPTNDFSVSCLLHGDELECCVEMDEGSDHDLLTNSLPTHWSMSLHRPYESNWDTKNLGENEELCINWTVQNIMCETNYIVVANASNNLGFALSNVTFCPLDVVKPGPVMNLSVTPDTEQPHRLMVWWDRPKDLSLSRRLGMGGVNYTVDVYPLHHGQPIFHLVSTDLPDKEKTEETVIHFVEGLWPFTSYNVTVTPHSRCCAGSPTTVTTKTTESVPLIAPEIIAWVQTGTGVVIHWNVYAPEDQGGEIIAYSVCTQKTCQNVTFANSEHRLPQVTSGLVPERCILGCNVTVQAFTRKGPSNKSSTLKITPYLETAKKRVDVERKADGSYTVLWENSINNVVSILWCFGNQFRKDASHIRCQTALRKAAANFSCCSQTVNISQDDRKKYRETMESRWYFGIGIVSENQNTNSSITTGNPVQLHWQICVFDEEGDPPLPMFQVLSWENGTGLTIDANPICSNTLPAPGRPINATVFIAEKPLNCLSEGGVNANQLLQGKRQMDRGGLIPSSSYTVCVTYYGQQNKKATTKTTVLMASPSPGISVTILVAIFAVLGLFILSLLIGALCVQYKKKSKRFNSIRWPKVKDVQLKESCTSKPRILTNMAMDPRTMTFTDGINKKDSNIKTGLPKSSLQTSSPKHLILHSTAQSSSLTNGTTKVAVSNMERGLGTYIHHSDKTKHKTSGHRTPEMVPLISKCQSTMNKVHDDHQVNNIEVRKEGTAPQEAAVLSDVQSQSLPLKQCDSYVTNPQQHALLHSMAGCFCVPSLEEPMTDNQATQGSPRLCEDIHRFATQDLPAYPQHTHGKSVLQDEISQPVNDEDCMEEITLTKKSCMSVTSSKSYVKCIPNHYPEVQGALSVTWKDNTMPSESNPTDVLLNIKAHSNFHEQDSSDLMLPATTKTQVDTRTKSSLLTLGTNHTINNESYIHGQGDSSQMAIGYLDWKRICK